MTAEKKHKKIASLVLVIIMLVSVGVGGLAASQKAAAQLSWRAETVDGGESDVGHKPSLAFDGAGHPHIAYIAGPWVSSHVLKYATYDGTTWHVQTIDTVGIYGSIDFPSLALDADGRPHIAYAYNDRWDGEDRSIKYASYDGATWTIKTIGAGRGPSLALDADGRPHIAYAGRSDATTNSYDILNYTAFDGTTWHTETVDNDRDCGWSASLAVDSAGRPHIAYGKYVSGETINTYSTLKYATYDGTAWHNETVDGYTTNGQDISLAVDGSGHPHISYSAYTPDIGAIWADSLIRYATYDGTAWHNEVIYRTAHGPDGKELDRVEHNWRGVSIALDSAGQPHTCFFYAKVNASTYRNEVGDVVYASRENGTWSFEPVHREGHSPFLAFDPNGWPHIAYLDLGSDLASLGYASAQDSAQPTPTPTPTITPTPTPTATPTPTVTPTPTPTPQPSPSTLTAIASRPLVSPDEQFIINGTLTASGTPVTNALVYLQTNTSGTWVNASQFITTTNSEGGYNFTLSEPTAGTYHYRVVYDGDATIEGTTSDVVTVTVAPRPSTLTATVIPPLVAPDEDFIISGALTTTSGTPVTDAPVYLQTNTSGAWNASHVGPTTTNASGDYTFTFGEPAEGTYRYRVVYDGDATIEGTTSNVVSVTVTPHVGTNETTNNSVIPPSTSEEVSTTVTTTENATFSVQYPGSKLGLTLTSPTGQVIDGTKPPLPSNVQYWDDIGSVGYTVTNPAPGKWTMHITAIDVPTEGEPYVAVTSYTPNEPATTLVTVPANPIAVTSAVSVSAAFIDPNALDTHTAAWAWGDGSTSVGTVSEKAGAGTVAGSHTYAQPGVYTVSVKMTDGLGAASEAKAQTFVVVYDPAGGFVTGGGWIESLKGAYVAQLDLTGKAAFGFEAKYEKGATKPSGHTEFQFHVANVNFKSTSYDWLVLAGSKAMYKGVGTINGEGSYKFMLSAVDGTPDLFRMKISDATGKVVYDNQIGAGDDAAPTTALGGGSIVIHR